MAEYLTTLDQQENMSSSLCKQSSTESVVHRTPAYHTHAPNPGSQSAEITALLRHLVEHNSSRRAEVLRTLRKLLKKSGGQLPDVDRLEFFEAFYHMIGDSRWKVACECTMLIVDVVPQMGDHDLDQCMSVVLPKVIPNLGHESIDVRRATLRLLHVYMRYTNNLQRVLRMYVQYGLEGPDKNAQKGCILSLPLLFTEEFGNENLFPLVESLGNLLVNAETSLFYPVFLALQRLHTLVGNDVFKMYLRHINPEAVILYQKVLSRNSTANSLGRNENIWSETEALQDDATKNSVDINKIITCGEAAKPFEEEEEEPMKLDSNANRFDNKNLKETESTVRNPNNFDADFALRYGVFPSSLLNRALSNKITEKNDGISQMLSLLREAPSNHISALVPYLEDFMTNFVNRLVDHPNFKITLHALDMVEAVIERLKLTTLNFIKPIIAVLFKRLGDSRAVVREHNVRILHRMMFHFPPQQVLDCILEQKYHRNPKIREEVVNRATAALLMFPRNEFDLCKLSYDIAPMLVDNKRMVRLAALECVAVIAQALGPHRLSPLMSAVEAIECGSESEGLMNAVQARLSRRDLPRCNPDGMIRYVLNPMTYSGWFPSSTDADVEWVMLASATNSGTPPKFPSMNASGHHYSSRHQRGTMRMNTFSVKNTTQMHSGDITESVVSSEDSGRSELSSSDLVTILDFQTKFLEREQSKDHEDEKSAIEDSSTAEPQSFEHLDGLEGPSMSHLAKPEEPRLKSGKTPNESRRASCVSLDSNLNKEEKLIVQQSLEDQSLPPNENLLQQSRHNRAFSMPHIIPEPLSDISEKSTEASSVHRFLSVDNESPNEEKKKIPHSVPSSPQKIYGHNLDPNIDYNRPKSEAAVVKPQTGRKASVAFMEPSTSVDGSRDGDHEPEQQQQQQQQTLRPQSRLQVEQSKDESRQSSAVSRPISSNSASPIGDVPYVYSPAEQMPLISLPPATNGESNKGLTRSQSKSSDEPPEQETLKKDAQTQKDESDLSSCTTSTPDIKPKDSRVIVSKVPVSRTPGVRRKPMIPVKQRTARSISPRPRRPTHQIIRVQPAIQPNANIRHILENVAKTEGPFEQPDEALKAAMATFTQDAWTTKVEGMLAITRLATFHPTVLYKDIHTIVLALVYEVKNLRSSVSRSAIFTLGDLFIKLKKLIEPDMEIICQALLQKCGENVAFIRDDIDKALSNMIEEMPQTKSALALVHSGASHRNMNVRRTAAQFLETLVERMGATKCLMGPRDLGENLLPAAARFVMDGSPQTRYYGRRIFSVLMQHPLFDRLLRRHISPGTYRNIHGILESIKRRGVGEKPADVMATKS